MRKFFLTAIVLIAAVTMQAQKGEKSLGLGLSYGSEVKSIGIGAKFNYNVTDAIRLAPSFNYFLEKDGLSEWEINADAHYLFPINDKLTVYPLAGLAYTNWKTAAMDYTTDEDYPEYDEYDEEYSDSSTNSGEIGINLGGGLDYKLTEKFSIGAELKYSIISNFNQLVLGAKVTYTF